MRSQIFSRANRLKITGIDIVILSNETVYLAQLKTLKGTLTGSQKTRAEKELGIHENPLFIAVVRQVLFLAVYLLESNCKDKCQLLLLIQQVQHYQFVYT